MARVLTNQRITSSDHFQDTRHIEIDLEGSGLSYEPGDLLAIVPRQDPGAVGRFLRRTGLDAGMWVSIAATSEGCEPAALLQARAAHCSGSYTMTSIYHAAHGDFPAACSWHMYGGLSAAGAEHPS